MGCFCPLGTAANIDAPVAAEAEQLLPALRRRADDDQDALLGVFKTGLQVSIIGAPTIRKYRLSMCRPRQKPAPQ